MHVAIAYLLGEAFGSLLFYIVMAVLLLVIFCAKAVLGVVKGCFRLLKRLGVFKYLRMALVWLSLAVIAAVKSIAAQIWHGIVALWDNYNASRHNGRVVDDAPRSCVRYDASRWGE